MRLITREYGIVRCTCWLMLHEVPNPSSICVTTNSRNLGMTVVEIDKAKFHCTCSVCVTFDNEDLFVEGETAKKLK